MTQEKTLGEMLNDIQGRTKLDYVSPRNKMQVDAVDGDLVLSLDGTYNFRPSPHCVKQLNESIAPGFSTYSKWLMENGRQNVYVQNVNSALAEDGRKAQVRTITTPDGRNIARGIMSDMFKPIDDDLIYGVAIPVISEFALSFKTIGGNRTDTNSYLKIVSRNPVFEVEIAGKTRAFSAGFIMKNSEVGCGYCEFVAFLTDNYCNNGVIFSKTVIADVQYVHKGARISTDFGLVMEDRFKQAEIDSVRAVIAEATRLACATNNYSEFCRQIVASGARKITGDVPKTIGAVCKILGLTGEEAESVKIHLDSSDLSQFGIQAAITGYAKTVNSYEKKIALEEAGGKLLEFNDKVWQSANLLA